MIPGETEIVHRVTIARLARPGRSAVYSATCRLCKIVIEQKEWPLTIATHGLVAVRSIGNEILKFWTVPEPLESEVTMCSKEGPASYTVSTLESLLKRTASGLDVPRIQKQVALVQDLPIRNK